MKRWTAPPRVADVAIDDDFWGRYDRLVREKVLPYQWEALNDRVEGADKSGCMHNFLVAAGRETGEHYGWYFQDSDLYKWLEAVAYTLAAHPNAELEKTADEVIDVLGEVQREDGYLDTYYQLAHPGQEWTCLREYHELYCAGHLIEAAVAYADATGKEKFLSIACRLADLIDRKFGPGEEQCKGYPGHEELELALIKLSEKTDCKRYADLAVHFINQRGQEPNYFKEELRRDPTTRYPWGDGPLAGMRYFQADRPVREQNDAYGHAVRACYLYSGIADAARVSGDETLLKTAYRMFDSISRRRMYVTGAIGSSGYGEAFTCDYDLPNDSVYGETCASIALAFFARRLLQIECRGEVADVMERAIYNTALAGMNLAGTNFFYVNPLEIEPESLKYDYYKKHVLPERPKWYGCACCPPNIARLVASIAQYAWLENENAAYLSLFLGGTARLEKAGFTLEVKTQYPWEGRVSIRVVESRGAALCLRRPGWCEKAEIFVNGEKKNAAPENGYYRLEGLCAGDEIVYEMAMTPHRVRANTRVREDAGCIAVQRGPIVYCLEEKDNGKELFNLLLPRKSEIRAEWRAELLGGVVTLSADGLRVTDDAADAPLYLTDEPGTTEQRLLFVPYFRWNNRGAGEMRVFVREST